MPRRPPANTKPKPSYPIGSVDRAFRLLSVFKDHASVSVSEAAIELDVPRSTAHRMLAMLVYHGYARQNPETKEYVAGPMALELGLGVLKQMDVARHAREIMADLAATLEETVHLAMLNGRDVTFVDGIESDKALRAGLRVGVSLPAHATATGKALLAQRTPDRVRELFPETRLAAVTPGTIRQRSKLESELAAIRQRGYALNHEESEPGLVAVAAAFSGPSNNSAIAVAGPSVRLKESDLARIGALLVLRLDDTPRLKSLGGSAA